jgi:molecular chaperone DnaK (HSP70)
VELFWSLDLGTTNTVVAVCEGDQVRSVALKGISAPAPYAYDEEYAGGIPSAVELRDPRGRQAAIGQQAVDKNWAMPSPALARSFKRPLGRSPDRAVATFHGKPISARQAAEVFVREVLGELRSQYPPPGFWGKLRARWRFWPSTLTIPVPVDSFETYGREVRIITRRCGVRSIRTIEEPVAAALGYGLDIRRQQTLLIVDFGGGTLDMAVVRIGAAEATRGRGEVLSVTGDYDLGGDRIDDWLIDVYCKRTRTSTDLVRHSMTWRAQALKHRLSRPGAPPEEWGGEDLSRRDLIALLDANGLYDRVAAGALQALREAEQRKGEPVALDDVLLTGGSTLLPDFPERLQAALGRAVRRWRPFDAVARGAALFAAGCPVEPVIYHDYALRVRIPNTTPAEYEFERILQGGSRYPTPIGEEVVRHYAAAYDQQEAISLPICEIGRFGWKPASWEGRANGRAYWRAGTEAEKERVVCLNESDPDIPLRPAGRPNHTRLRVIFRVDENRRIRATIHDLERRENLRNDIELAEVR